MTFFNFKGGYEIKSVITLYPFTRCQLSISYFLLDDLDDDDPDPEEDDLDDDDLDDDDLDDDDLE